MQRNSGLRLTSQRPRESGRHSHWGGDVPNRTRARASGGRLMRRHCGGRLPGFPGLLEGLRVRRGQRCPWGGTSAGPEPQHPGQRLLGAGVDEVGAGRRAEGLPVPAAEGGEAVHRHEAFVALPPAGETGEPQARGRGRGRPVPGSHLLRAPRAGATRPAARAAGRHQRAGLGAEGSRVPRLALSTPLRPLAPPRAPPSPACPRQPPGLRGKRWGGLC